MQPDPIATPGLPTPPRPCLDCTTPTRNKGQRCDTHTHQRTQQHNQDRAYYHTAEWRHLRDRILDRDHHQCVLCTSIQRLTIHHIHARKNGGADTAPNLVTLCHHHHDKVERAEPNALTQLRQHLTASPHSVVAE